MKIIIDVRDGLETQFAMKCVSSMLNDINDMRKDMIYTFLQPIESTRTVNRVVVFAKRNKASTTFRCGYIGEAL